MISVFSQAQGRCTVVCLYFEKKGEQKINQKGIEKARNP